MKIAQFKHIEYGFIAIQNVDDKSPGYIQVSEPIDVEFSPSCNEEIVKKEIAALDDAISNIRATAQSNINGIEQRKAELLALPNLGGE